MGDQTLSVARELAGGVAPGRATVLFTDVAGLQLLVVPAPVGFVVLGLLVAAFAWIGYRRGGILRGLGVFLAGIVIAGAAAWICLFLMGLARPGSFWRAFPIWTQLAAYACGLVGGVAALAVIGRHLTVPHLRASFWLGFLLLGVAVFFIAPGGVIYFLLPPLVAFVGMVARQERIGAIVAALLLWLTVGEVLALLGELMNNGPFFVFAPLAMVLAMPWMIEAKPLIGRAGRLGAIAASLLVMLAGWVAVATVPAYSADRQQRFTIQHLTDTGSGKSHWSILNDHAALPESYGGSDKWRWQELPLSERKRWVASAPPVPALRPPQIGVVSRSRIGNLRTVQFRIRANGAESVSLIAPEDARLTSAGSGVFVLPFTGETNGEYTLTCFGRSCSGKLMQFTTTSTKPIAIKLVGSRRGLPPSAKPLLDERPRFARPQYSPDATLTVSRVAL
jgi:hypothetical protein